MKKANNASTGSTSGSRKLKMPQQGLNRLTIPVLFQVECLECGRKFKTTSMFPSCPKCKGSDIDIA